LADLAATLATATQSPEEGWTALREHPFSTSSTSDEELQEQQELQEHTVEKTCFELHTVASGS